MGVPTISVVIPAYNSVYLGEAVASARAQTHPPMEIIVVDDGSEDDTAARAEALGRPVKVLREPHLGPGGARNRGVAAAGGELIAFLDSDDLWHPEKLARQVAALRANPSISLVFAQYEQFNSPDIDPAATVHPQGQAERFGRSTSAVLCRAATFTAVGPLREDLRVGEFIDWYERATAQGLRSFTVPAPLVRRRIHRSNLTRTAGRERDDYAILLKARLDHRRANASADATRTGARP